MNKRLKNINHSNHFTKITVVTVVFNDAAHIEKTILSVTGQSCPDIEYIIVDGGSTDGTLDIINRYRKKISTLISEPDHGLYDAMNKSIDLAKGEWIIFINSGDTFFSDTTVSDIFSRDYNGYDIVYGDYVFQYKSGLQTHIVSRPLETIWKYMPICHQAMFVKTGMLRKHKFSIDNISADHEFLWKCLKENCTLFNTQKIVSVYLEGGVSADRNIQVLLSRRRNAMNMAPSVKVFVWYIYYYLMQNTRNIIRKTLPKPLLHRVVKMNNRKIIHRNSSGT